MATTAAAAPSHVLAAAARGISRSRRRPSSIYTQHVSLTTVSAVQPPPASASAPPPLHASLSSSSSSRMRTCRPYNTCDSFVRYQSTNVSTAASSQSNSDSVLADFFPADEYVDVWATASSSSSSPSISRRTIEPLNCPELDRPTRFLLSLLDDSIHGIRRGKDKATTARCHTQLERLADLSIGGKRLRGRAQRADEILKRMEKILLLNAGGTGSGNTNAVTDGGSNRESSKSLYAAQHKYELPLPNRKTYLMVLRLYAQTSGPAALAERAEAIVANMEAASAKRGDLSLRPQTVAYNQAISAWASSTDPNKAYRAARVLAKLKEMGMADASSYGHVLRACATTVASSVDVGVSGTSDDGTSNELHRSQQAALKIAMGLWRDLDGKMKRRNGQEARGTSIGNDDDGINHADVDADFDTTTQGEVEMNNDADLVSSHFYTFLIRTLQFMPKPAERDAAVSKAFKDCCQYGMVNAHVLQVMYSVASEATCQDLLGDRLASQAVTAMKTVSGAAILAQKVPDPWTRKAVVVNSWGW